MADTLVTRTAQTAFRVGRNYAVVLVRSDDVQVLLPGAHQHLTFIPKRPGMTVVGALSTGRSSDTASDEENLAQQAKQAFSVIADGRTPALFSLVLPGPPADERILHRLDVVA